MSHLRKRGFVYLLSILVFCVLIQHSEVSGKDTNIDDIVFIVLSQSNIYHATRADLFKEHLKQQAQGVAVHLLHERWPQHGAWTITPLYPDFVKHFHEKSAIFFCEEETRIDLKMLMKELNRYDLSKELFLGKGLRDKSPTIIHHFAFHNQATGNFLYPDPAAGFLLSLSLIKSLATKPFKIDFSIDAKHELAMFIWQDGSGLRLKDVDFLCTKPSGDKCVTTFPHTFPSCSSRITEDELFIAVKTCSKFHAERVPVVKDTWGKDTTHIEYYSDLVDRSIPTIDLGVPNTERGHCGKTMAILKRFRQNNSLLDNQYKWLIITDDDTLLSVARLRRLLACYDENEPVVIGERYGYGVSDQYGGYNYITGGGGMVFSSTAVKMLIDLGKCQCGTDDSPDDMILGMCFQRLGIIPVHSPHFHQARPDDYCRSFLEHQQHVSFHKHWMNDPRQDYKKWLKPGIDHDLDSTSRDEL